MKKNNKINNLAHLEQFINEFSGIISAFESGIENVMNIISGSFDLTRGDAEDITRLFKDSRSEVETIFSIFSGIVGIFSGGGGLIESLLGFLPGGEFLSTILGGSVHEPGSGALNLYQPVNSHTENFYPAPVNNIPAPVVIVNTQLEKAGMYRVYREGKMISEARP